MWDYKHSVFDHFALTPWNIPDQKYIDTVVALARTAALFLFDLGYFKLHAFARIADAGSYFLSRLNHQTTILDADTEQLHPLELVFFQHGEEPQYRESYSPWGKRAGSQHGLLPIVYQNPSSIRAEEGHNMKAKKEAILHHKRICNC